MHGSGLTRLARAAACVLFLATAGAAHSSANRGTTLYRNAKVWTGKGFEKRDLATRDGRFIDPRQAGSAARVVSLNHRYVVPAYANAHTHMTGPTDTASRQFIDAGVFYAWNPNSNAIPLKGKAFFARLDTYDVAIAQGGITVRGGHPVKLFADMFRGRTVESLVGDVFHYGETPSEIDAALNKLVEQRADFVKAYLLFSEVHARRSGRDQVSVPRGLDPALAGYVVSAAKKRGLKVVFHTETLADLRAVMGIGALAVMHMPGYGPTFSDKTPEKWALTDADAKRIAKSGLMIVTTAGLMKGFDGTLKRGAIEAKQRSLQAENLRRLARHGAVVLIGTDNSSQIFTEAEHLASLGALRPIELLQIVLGTGRHLFPRRRIGCFATGCEADFLVLREDPLSNITALRTIELRIKAGYIVPGPTRAVRP